MKHKRVRARLAVGEKYKVSFLRRRRSPLHIVADERAGACVDFFVAGEELFDNFHSSVNGFVDFGVMLFDGDRVVRDMYDCLEGFDVAVRAFLIDDELRADDGGRLAIGEFFRDMLEFGRDVFLNGLAGRFMPDLNSNVHKELLV